MTTIEATYKVVTPLFCSGAAPDRAELRPPSFKGVLRFWWRALAWSRYDGDLAAIKRNEDDLFGSAAGHQSRILMRLSSRPTNPAQVATKAVLTVSASSRSNVVGEGARYLGYGVLEASASRKKNTQAGELTRACLRSPLEFTVYLRARDLEQDVLESVQSALTAVGTLGGMGAKSRKGYGSLVLRSLKIDGHDTLGPSTVDALERAISGLYAPSPSDALPELTALSGRSRHVLLVGEEEQESLELLDLVGRELVRFRSWGRDGKILGGKVDSEQRFKDDHDPRSWDRERSFAN